MKINNMTNIVSFYLRKYTRNKEHHGRYTNHNRTNDVRIFTHVVGMDVAILQHDNHYMYKTLRISSVV